MSAFAGVQGYEALASAQQLQRRAPGHGLAQKPSATPAHLSRVLYISPHGSSDPSLAVGADLSAEYAHAIRHAPMGGSDVIGPALMGTQLFVTRLGTIKKPAADSQPRYALDATARGHDQVSATLRRSRRAGQDLSATISLPGSTADFQLTADQAMDVTASFPIPDTTSSAGTARHPFFTLRPHGDSRRWQWQIDPLRDGALRYTLVETDDDEQVSSSKPESIKAIYHHIGPGASLCLPSSEGVVLVPEDDGDETELLVVASLLGLLWRVRGIEVRPPPVHQASDGGKPTSFLQRLLGKR